MDLAERQRQFVDAVQEHVGATKLTRLNKLFGVSNSAKIVEGGIQIGVANLDRLTPEGSGAHPQTQSWLSGGNSPTSHRARSADMPPPAPRCISVRVGERAS